MDTDGGYAIMINRFRLFAIILLLAVSAVSYGAKNKGIKGMPRHSVDVMSPSQVNQKMSYAAYLSFTAGGYGQNTAEGYWIALSDRNKNTTYYAPDCKEAYSSLSFGEKVLIARIKKDNALVYSVSNMNYAYPSVPSPESCLGWVPMSSLLLNTKTMLSSDGNDIKVLFRNEESGARAFSVSDSPENGASSMEIDNKSSSIFYAAKILDDKILISQSDTANDEEILGWVKTTDVFVWNSRLALENTWEPLDIRTFSEDCAGAVLKDKGGNVVGNIPFSMSMYDPYDCNRYRMTYNQWRFPYLTTSELSYGFAIPSSSSLLVSPSESHLGHMSEPKVVNIFLILDGSRRYEDCFPVISESLSSIPSLTGCEVRVGAMVYHDSRNTDNLIESHQLSSVNSQSLYSFIDNGGKTYGFKDNLTNAPLCKALGQAIDFADFRPEDANYILIIGGRGDDSDSDLDPVAVSKSLHERNISLYGIQVRNESKVSSYRNFKYLVEDIVMRLNTMRKGAGVCCRNDAGDEGVVYSSYAMRGSNDDLFGGVCSINSGIMAEEVFKKCYFDVLRRIGDDCNKSTNVSTPQMFRFVTSLKHIRERSPFKFVVLYSEKELAGIKLMFRELCGTRESDERKQLLSVIQSCVATLPIPIQESAYMDMGYREVIRYIEGFPMFEGEYCGDKLKDVLSKNAVRDDKLRFITDEIAKKYALLEMVSNMVSVYGININGEQYFWIPVDYLI